MERDGQPAMKPFWEIDGGRGRTGLEATTWYPAVTGYFRGGGFSSQLPEQAAACRSRCAGSTWSRASGPVLQIAEGWTVDLPAEVHDVLDQRTDPTWPTHWFVPALTGNGPFRDVYSVMTNWGANHGAISYGHIGADLISLASMLRIPVGMHNVPAEQVFRPSAWTIARHGRSRGRRLPRLRELRAAVRAPRRRTCRAARGGRPPHAAVRRGSRVHTGGGGNSSVKVGGTLYIKPSGLSLANVTATR